MMYFLLFLIFAATVAALWFHGTWNNCVTLINMTLAMMIATNYYEPICFQLEQFDASFTYLLDFVVIWVLFGITFLILRLITDMLSTNRVKFITPVEMALRSLTALWGGWLLICFIGFTLHFAPLNSESPGGALASPPSSMSAFGAWHSFMKNRSAYALSRGHFDPMFPDSTGQNVQQFDSKGDFFDKYHDRRVRYQQAEMMRVNP
ncbi:MAG TPA: hypothetical protein VMP01_01570 [Pirellulaceae bacterium]|nr:hypothetical protein [Pirellulaceae bacterium]